MIELTKEGNLAKDVIEHLTSQQGYYGRLHRKIMASENPNEIFNDIGKGCSDAVEVILKIET